MRKLILVVLLVTPSIGSTSVMRSYWLVWDTGKIAAFGMGFGYNIFYPGQPKELPEENDKVFGPVVGAELGITGYEYSAGLELGKRQYLARKNYLVTIFTGRSENWKHLKTNIDKDHYVMGVRLNYKFINWALKYHTDFEKEKMVSIQFGIGE